MSTTINARPNVLQCPKCDTPMSLADEANHMRCPNCGTYLNVVLVPYVHTDRDVDVDKLRKAGL